MQTIGETAALAAISTKTLRYYDRIGLLKPRARSANGHRIYGTQELLRLREILIWRQLGFPLADIAALIDDPSHGRLEALRRQLSIARSQLDRFRGMTRGLELAIAAFEVDRTLTDEDIFAGFALSLSEDENTEPAMDPPEVHASEVQHAGRRQAERGKPVRIVATDPVRIGENLLALGIVPVGTGTFWDPIDEIDFCPWPDLIEAPIRERVQGLGYYGTEKDLVARARPDLIFDLLFTKNGMIGCEQQSRGKSSNKCRHEDLCDIAPNVLLEAPISGPAFLGRIKTLATVLSLEDRVDPLVAAWEARTTVLRAHVSGQTVSAFNAWNTLLEANAGGVDPDSIVGLAPNLSHEGQLFSALGLELLPPCPEGDDSTHWGGAAYLTAGAVCQLSAPTLLLTLENLTSPQRFRQLLQAEPLARLPAVRSGRTFDFRWIHTRSGWFSAHWQLDVIARAFGVWRLRTAGLGPGVHMAVSPSGRVTLAAAGGNCIARLCGPRISDINVELTTGEVTEVDVGEDVAHLCSFPEAYSLITGGAGERQLTPDRESALERVTQRYVA